MDLGGLSRRVRHAGLGRLVRQPRLTLVDWARAAGPSRSSLLRGAAAGRRLRRNSRRNTIGRRTWKFAAAPRQPAHGHDRCGFGRRLPAPLTLVCPVLAWITLRDDMPLLGTLSWARSRLRRGLVRARRRRMRSLNTRSPEPDCRIRAHKATAGVVSSARWVCWFALCSLVCAVYRSSSV
jgi:hypothetical protein